MNQAYVNDIRHAAGYVNTYLDHLMQGSPDRMALPVWAFRSIREMVATAIAQLDPSVRADDPTPAFELMRYGLARERETDNRSLGAEFIATLGQIDLVSGRPGDISVALEAPLLRRIAARFHQTPAPELETRILGR